MATRKTVTPTANPTTKSRSPRRPAPRTVTRTTTPRVAFNPINLATKVATQSLRLGLGTALLISENAVKFYNEAMDRGNKVELNVPNVNFPALNINAEKLEQLREIPTNSLNMVQDNMRKLMEEASTQISKFSRRREKKQDTNIEEEVINVIETLDLPKKSDLKDFKKQITELSKKVEKLATTQTPVTA